MLLMTQSLSACFATCGDEFGNPHSTFAVLGKVPHRGHEGLFLFVFLTAIREELRLVVEHIVLRRPAVHEEEDDPFWPSEQNAGHWEIAFPRYSDPALNPAIASEPKPHDPSLSQLRRDKFGGSCWGFIL